MRRPDTACVLALLALGDLGLVPACKRKEASDGAERIPALAASAEPAPVAPAPRCRRVPASATLTLTRDTGKSGEKPEPTTESDAKALRGVAPEDVPDGDPASEPTRAPFAVEVSSAVALTRGFALSYLEHGASETHAKIAFVDPDVRSPVKVDLGRVHRDVEAPRLAGYRDSLAVIVADRQGQKDVLRLAVLDAKKPAPEVTWAGGLDPIHGRSEVFDVGVGEALGLAVWQEFDKATRKGVVRGATFGLGALPAPSRSRMLSPSQLDVEAPRLARRPGGFWLAWLEYPPAPRAGGQQPIGASPPAPVPSEPEARPLLELGPRVLAALPLDTKAIAVGNAIALTPPSSRVVAYDIADAADGSVVFAWREEAGGQPGLDDEVVNTARVEPDGTVKRAALELAHSGRGVPTLLLDAAPPRGLHSQWLSLAGMDDRTALGALDGELRLVDAFGPEAEIRYAEPLELHAGRLLLAASRGPEVELSVVNCVPGLPSPTTAPTPSGDVVPAVPSVAPVSE